MNKKEIGIISIENLYFGYFKAIIAGRAASINTKTAAEYAVHADILVDEHRRRFPK